MGTDRGLLGNFLQQKYLEWINEVGEVRSQKDFASYLGLKPATFNHYYNGNRKNIDDPVVLEQLAAKLGDEIYSVLGLEKPKFIDVRDLPSNFRSRIRRASAEVNAILRARHLTGDMPEAETVTIEIFAKYGFKYTDTE